MNSVSFSCLSPDGVPVQVDIDYPQILIRSAGKVEALSKDFAIVDLNSLRHYLCKAIDTRRRDVITIAIPWLCEIGGFGKDALLHLLRDPDDRLRWLAASMLGSGSSNAVLEGLSRQNVARLDPFLQNVHHDLAAIE